MMQTKAKLACLALLLVMVFPAMAAGQTTVPEGPVWGEWTLANSPFTVTGCIEIRNGDTLEIEPGVDVLFDADAHLVVRDGGTLEVDPVNTACPADVLRVTFDESTTDAGWLGIKVQDGGTAILNYVDIQNSSDSGLMLDAGAATTLNYVAFAANSGRSGGGIYSEEDVTITNGVFAGNSALLYGGGIEAVGSNVVLTDVSFNANSAGVSGGAIDILSGNLLQTRGSLISNSSLAGSAVMLYATGAVITNAFFYSQAGGPVISRIGTSALILTYTTLNGNAGVAGIQGNSDDAVTIFGSIIWGNGSSLSLTQDGGAVPSITYSDIEGLAGLPLGWIGAGNFDADPVFAAAGDYLLDDSSPALGAALGQDMGVTGGASAPGPDLSFIDSAGDAVADPFDLGTVAAGSSIQRTIFLVNEGQESVTLNSATIVGAQSGAFSIGTLGLPTDLDPGNCLPVAITFAPDDPGDYTFATLRIMHTGDDSPEELGLAGDTQEASGNDITVSDETIDFGTVIVGSTSDPESFTLTNPVGNGGIISVELALAGSDAARFGLSETSFNIPSGGDRTIWAMFTPNDIRAFEAIVQIEVNGVAKPDSAILLVGEGKDTVFNVDPTEHQFDPAILGTSADQAFTVENELASTSILMSAVISGTNASSFTVDMASFPIAASDTEDVTVTFTPQTEGFLTANLTLSTVVDSVTYDEVVELRGVGIPTTAGIGVAPTDLAFPDTQVGDTEELTFTVTNNLNAFVSVDIADPATAQFVIASATSFILFPTGDASNRDERTISVEFTPTDDTTLFSDSVDVDGTLSIFTVGSETVMMSGRGVASDLDVAPDEIDFGDVDLGTTATAVSVSVLNLGTDTANVFAALLSGTNADEFDIETDTCSGNDVDPGLACYIEVSATPAAAGDIEGVLSIYTSESALPFQVDLLATGVTGAADIEVDPTTVDLGDVAVFVAAADTTTITNTGGSGTLTVSDITFSGVSAAQFSALPATPFDIAPGGTQDVTVSLTATGLGPRTTTMTIESSVGNVDVTVTADAQVGYADLDGADIDGVLVHDPGDTIYIVPGVPGLPTFYRNMITALGALTLPADLFVWVEGTAFRQYLSVAGTWEDAGSISAIESSDAGAILDLLVGDVLVTQPTFPGEGAYTMHFGFDLIRNNRITNFPYFYVDAETPVVNGPAPLITVSDTTLNEGDPHPNATFAAIAGTSTTDVEIYIFAVPASGGVRWLDVGGTWHTGGSSDFERVYNGDVSAWAGQAIANPWTGYPLTDSGQIGEHRLYVTIDTNVNDSFTSSVFQRSVTITVDP